MSETLLAVIIGGLISFAATFFMLFLQKCGDRERFSRAITSEINSIIYIVDKRKYRELLEDQLQLIRRDGVEPNYLKIFIKNDYFQLFTCNQDKIGFLKNPKPEDVVKFYTLCKALLEDVRSMTEGEWSGIGPDNWIRLLSDMLLLFDEMVAIQLNIVDSRNNVSSFDVFAGEHF